MIAKVTLEAADMLTIETQGATALPLTYFFTWAKAGDANFTRSLGTFTDIPETVVPVRTESAVVGSFAVQNPNATNVTVALRVGAIEIIRCVMEAENIWTDKGVFTKNGHLRLTSVASGSATLDANSPIAGLNAAYDTPAKLAAALEALQVFKALNDTDGNNISDTSDDNQSAPDYASQFNTGLF